MGNEIPRRNLSERLIMILGRFIDFPSAIAGAVIMGLIVGAINFGYGWWPALTAALKQAAYTFIFGGTLIKFLYTIAGKIHGRMLAAVLSSLIVSIITIFLVFGLHSLKGTPMPLESTIPTAILAPFGFAFLAYRRKGQRPKNKETA